MELIHLVIGNYQLYLLLSLILFYLSPILRKFHTKQQGKTKLKVDVVSSLFVIRTEILKSVGYFDERTFLYGEENILALKLKRIGLNNYILLNDKFSHVHGEVINKKFSSRQIL